MSVILFFLIVSGLLELQGLNLSDLTQQSGSVGWRGRIWGASLSMIQESPFFGHGLNTYMRLLGYYNLDASFSPTYAHNSFLQLTVETGIAGLIAFLWILVKLFSDSLANLHLFQSGERWVMIGAMAGLIAFLIHSFFDNNFYALQLTVCFWYMAGLMASLTRISLQKRNI